MRQKWSWQSLGIAKGGRVSTRPSPRMHAARFAFFDVDETLICIKSMLSFKEFWHLNATAGTEAERVERHLQFMRQIEDYQRRGQSREFINRTYYASYRGQEPAQIRTAARAWFLQIKATRPDVYVVPVLNRLRAHRTSGAEPVLVSGSSIEILAPLAEELGVRHVLATRLEVEAGRYTGRILPPQMIGDGKQVAARSFMEQHGADPQACFAYGDHPSDLPLLEAVGNPRVVGDNPHMLGIAVQRGWEVVQTRNGNGQAVL